MAGTVWNDSRFYCKLVHEKAHAPERKSKGAAGYDLYSCESQKIPAWSRSLINIGIHIKLPSETYGRVAPRSGLSLQGISIGAGVIDSDYRGEVKVLLFNMSDQDFSIKIGDRIAQLIIERIYTEDVCVVEEDLPTSDRGSGGFESTGR